MFNLFENLMSKFRLVLSPLKGFPDDVSRRGVKTNGQRFKADGFQNP